MKPVASEILQGSPGCAHVFLGRQGGVSAGVYASLNCGPGSGDDAQAVAENRRRALAQLGAKHLNTLYQVHSSDAVIVTQGWTREGAPHADGMATKERGIALGVLAADCAPVLLADVQAGVIGAAHAGWKGALNGIVEATIAAMESLGAQRPHIRAAVGPCIAQDAYEVGPEFFDRFVVDDTRTERFFVKGVKPRHWQFDLSGFVVARLGQAGVGKIDPLNICTYADEDGYFSYRRSTHRSEADYGRNLSAIVLTP
jgi:YfiH family protein